MTDVAKKSSAVLDMEPDWTLARALLGGTRAMRKAGKEYLPQWPNEDRDAYECRLKTAVLFPAYQRTVETLTGKPFSKPVTIGEDVPEQIKEWLDDVDRQGRNLDAFAADLMECALGYGLCGILVDYPDTKDVPRNAAGLITQEAEKAAGLRPYFIHIYPWQICGGRATRVNGAWRLKQLRLMECVEEDDGDFGTKEVEQVRVLEPGTWATYRKNPDKKDEWALHAEGVTTLSYIPFVPVYGQRTGFMTAKPPLIEVAHLNVAHWQSASDQQTILHVARVPILFLKMFGEDARVTVGGSAAMKAEAPESDAKFVEHSGAAIEAGANDLDKIEERMRQAGAELLVLSPGKITATQVATENAVGMCALQRIVQGEEDALDQALQIMAEWVKLPEGGHVTIFNDFGAANLAEASAELLHKMKQSGDLSRETLLNEIKRRGILSQEVDSAEEKERIDAEGPALGTLTDPKPAPANA
jgi:hypothetical protein